jgi:YidC/Oxa1 family membrane protein insertase
MEFVVGQLLQGLGQVLAFLYDIVKQYGVAIMLFTLLIRAALLPLTIKQTRSMAEMQRIQPMIKELQKKYKGDRQKLNEELMKVYKEHKVNPLGGCLPLVMQLPFFIALYAVLRAAIPAVAVPTEFSKDQISRNAVCAPVGEDLPRATGIGSNQIRCTDGGKVLTYDIAEWLAPKTGKEIQPPPEMFRCAGEAKDAKPVTDVDKFLCRSPLGSGHLPRDSNLYKEIVEKGTTFLGMELACSPSQASSAVASHQCSRKDTPGSPVRAIPYYVLVAGMVLTTWYQQKQMQQMSGQSNPQMQMMGRIMPVFLGFISLNIPAGVLIYWVTTNLWQVGQQRVMMRKRLAAEAANGSKPVVKPASKAKSDGAKGATDAPRVERPPLKRGGSGRNGGGSRKKRRKR